MSTVNELPPIMAHAKEDLAGNIQGDFSPEDWEAILERAAQRLRESSEPEGEAWANVIRAFHRERYWGFTPNYKKPKPKIEDVNLGKRFIWFSFRSFLVTKVIVLYAGARYSADYDPMWGWIFFGAIILMVSNYGFFIWKYGRNRKDEQEEAAARARNQ